MTLDLALVCSVSLETQQKVLVSPEVFEALVKAARMYAFLRDNEGIRTATSTIGGSAQTYWGVLGSTMQEDFDRLVIKRMEKK